MLKQLSTQVAIAIRQANLYEQLAGANQELQRLITLDGLTQVGNRRGFDEYLTREWQRSLRKQTPLALILCDIDFFKSYNDTYGHQAGDDCLRRVAHALCNGVERPTDFIARYGGEEFAVILPNTLLEGAVQVAERLCTAIQALGLPHASSLVSPYVTLSLGVASIVPHSEVSSSLLIAEADRALYLAKTEGRNCQRVLRLSDF